MRALDDDDYRKIERFLYSYRDMQRRIADQRSDILYGVARGSEVGGRSSVRSDPTAQKVIDMDRVPDQRWLSVIEYIQGRYSRSKKGALLQMCYFDQRSYSAICAELNIEPTTFYRWKEELVYCTAIQAAKRGLL